MKWKSCLLWVSILLVYPTIAEGQNTRHFEILTGSTYTFFPSGFARIDDCSPSDFQCDYGLAGSFSLEIDSLNRFATITNSNLVLEGNESVSGPSLTSPSGLAAWLESQFLLSVPAPTTIATYQGETPRPVADPLLLSFDNPGVNGSLIGGFDNRAFDGTGLNIQASLRQVAVPEPSAATVLSLFAVAAFGGRRRFK